MTLRDYQQVQLNFILDHMDTSSVTAVESPTGSGKSFVAMETARKFLEENPLTNVVISTGFNHLVFDYEKHAEEFSLKPLVLIGSRATNCPMEWEGTHPGEPFRLFTPQWECNCGTKHLKLDVEHKDGQKVCPYTNSEYRKRLEQVKGGSGYVVITNHSTLLAHSSNGLWDNCGLLIVDEAHTFATFYSSWMNLELDHDDLVAIEHAVSSMKPPMNMIVRSNIVNGRRLPQAQIDILCSYLNGGVQSRAKEFFETKPSPSVYIETGKDSYLLTRFYRSFEWSHPRKMVLFSATLDNFTLNMFNVHHADIYRERKQFCDYGKSEFIAMPREDFTPAFKEFLQEMDGRGLSRGLCLSTTYVDMRRALELDGFLGYHMTSSLDELRSYKGDGRIVLCGSRGLFQGIDIPELDFVCLNRIPFPNWDDKARAEQDFLTQGGRNGFDPWRQFTVPKTENDIIQSTGRLWRSPTSAGVVSIFDPRMERHAYMVRMCFGRYRAGIRISIKRNPDGPVEQWDP